ncbi:MAG: hypothetical protein JWR17_1821 [Pseudomonas sp.]|nr:hypothetical protein [Pseudomonas sp.]
MRLTSGRHCRFHREAEKSFNANRVTHTDLDVGFLMKTAAGVEEPSLLKW